MKDKQIDIMSLQETWVNTNSEEVVDGYNFIFSSGVDNVDREEIIKRQQSRGGREGKCRGRGIARGKGKGKSDYTGLEIMEWEWYSHQKSGRRSST